LASFGCLAAPAIFAAERTLIVPLQDVMWERVRGLFAEMRDEAHLCLAAMGVDAPHITLNYSADMRMVGQIHHIQIALTPDDLTPDELAGGAQGALCTPLCAHESAHAAGVCQLAAGGKWQPTTIDPGPLAPGGRRRRVGGA
jgi:hypothetical protein